jgi:MFS transporter, PAT family, beta-lactamase induction signal transducer AmpG
MLLLGFGGGVPAALILSTAQATLTEAGFSIALITALLWWRFPYAIKFLWAPILDRVSIFGLPRRAGWIMFLAGIMVIVMPFGPWLVSYQQWIVYTAILSFLGASYDTVTDGFRRDVYAESEYASATATFVVGYRAGMMFSGAVALGLADYLSWQQVYGVVAAGMFFAVGGLVVSRAEPIVVSGEGSRSFADQLRDTFWAPLRELLSRERVWWLVVFVMLFKVGDVLADAVVTPFLLHVGYSRTSIAAIAKGVGVASGLLGGVIGGILVARVKLLDGLLIAAVLQGVSNIGFWMLAAYPPDMGMLALVNGFEKVSSGIGGVVLATYLGKMTSKEFSGSQYALLSSLLGIPRDLLGGFAGTFAVVLGWSQFFLGTLVVSIPVLALLGYERIKRKAAWM